MPLESPGCLSPKSTFWAWSFTVSVPKTYVWLLAGVLRTRQRAFDATNRTNGSTRPPASASAVVVAEVVAAAGDGAPHRQEVCAAGRVRVPHLHTEVGGTAQGTLGVDEATRGPSRTRSPARHARHPAPGWPGPARVAVDPPAGRPGAGSTGRVCGQLLAKKLRSATPSRCRSSSFDEAPEPPTVRNTRSSAASVPPSGRGAVTRTTISTGPPATARTGVEKCCAWSGARSRCTVATVAGPVPRPGSDIGKGGAVGDSDERHPFWAARPRCPRPGGERCC